MSHIPEEAYPGMFKPFQGQARRPARYAFLHCEGTGYLHSQYLGQGVQGTATLARCCQTGELVVRKRAAFIDLEENPFADQLVVGHPNIVQLLAAHNYFNEQDLASSATYWRYANGKDLKSLVNAYRAAEQRVPEILIWHFLSQQLRAYHALFSSGMVHSDGHWANVLVHWDDANALPEFILGDLGLCDLMSKGIVTVPGQLPQIINVCTHETMSDFEGHAIFEQLHDYDQDSVPLYSYQYAEALSQIGEDIDSVSQCMVSMMHDENDLDDIFYSEQLRVVALMISNLPAFVKSHHIQTLERFEYLLTKFRAVVESCFAECLENAIFPVPGLANIQPRPVVGTPMLFDSIEALNAYSYRPPGPWYIATVDPDTYEVLDRGPIVHCWEKAVFTNSDGVDLDMSSEVDWMSDIHWKLKNDFV